MGFGAITARSIPLESSHRAGSNGIEHDAIAPKLKNPRPTILSPTISIFGGSSLSFGTIAKCSIPLESSHRAGSNGIEHVSIAPKLKNPCPTILSPIISLFGGSSMGLGAITAYSIPLELSHRAGSNGIEHDAIAPKPKNPFPITLSPTISIFGDSSMGFGAITACFTPLLSSHRAGSNGIEHVAIAPKPKNPCPMKPFPTISIFGGSSMGFGAIATCSIPLESSHRAGSNGIEHDAIAPKLKNPRPTILFPTISIFGGSFMGFGAIIACSIPLEWSH
jgi:hypothetical protein